MCEISRLARDERGVSLIEYCLLSALVAVALLFAANSLGAAVASTFGDARADLGAGAGDSHAALGAGAGDDGGDDDNDDYGDDDDGGEED